MYNIKAHLKTIATVSVFSIIIALFLAFPEVIGGIILVALLILLFVLVYMAIYASYDNGH